MQLTLAQAKDIIKHALAEQEKQGLKPLAIVVLGAGGSIKASESQDGTSLIPVSYTHLTLPTILLV